MTVKEDGIVMIEAVVTETIVTKHGIEMIATEVVVVVEMVMTNSLSLHVIMMRMMMMVTAAITRKSLAIMTMTMIAGEKNHDVIVTSAATMMMIEDRPLSVKRRTGQGHEVSAGD